MDDVGRFVPGYPRRHRRSRSASVRPCLARRAVSSLNGKVGRFIALVDVCPGSDTDSLPGPPTLRDPNLGRTLLWRPKESNLGRALFWTLSGARFERF